MRTGIKRFYKVTTHEEIMFLKIDASKPLEEGLLSEMTCLNHEISLKEYKKRQIKRDYKGYSNTGLVETKEFIKYSVRVCPGKTIDLNINEKGDLNKPRNLGGKINIQELNESEAKKHSEEKSQLEITLGYILDKS